MNERPTLSVDVSVLTTYFPEIVQCLNASNFDRKCTGCEFKQECKVISIVGFMMEKILFDVAVKNSNNDLIN
jgi:hypothetical protein